MSESCQKLSEVVRSSFAVLTVSDGKQTILELN